MAVRAAGAAADSARSPPVPHEGVSLAALRSFAAEHAGRSFAVPVGGGGPDASTTTLPFEALTTTQVVAAVIKPATQAAACAYAALLESLVRQHGGGRGFRVIDDSPRTGVRSLTHPPPRVAGRR